MNSTKGILLFALSVLLTGCTANPPPTVPLGVHLFNRHRRYDVTVQGDMLDVHVYQVIPLTRINTGSVKAAGLMIERPISDGFGTRKVLEYGITAIGNDFEYIYLPTDESIDEYVFLVRRLSGPGGDPDDEWRVHSAARDLVVSSSTLTIPQVKGLSKLNEQHQLLAQVREIEVLARDLRPP